MGTVVYFKWNEKEIATALCENRFDKESTCKGSCFLKKQLKKTDYSETSPDANNRIDDNFYKLVYFLEPIFYISFNTYQKFTSPFPIPSSDGNVKDFSKEIEYPPCS